MGLSRTTRYRTGYLGAIVLGGAALGFAYARWQPPWVVVLAVVAALLIPSRIQGLYWRDFFRGRRLMAARDYHAAILHFDRFLVQLRDRPSLKRLIWLNATVYTPSAEAMTLNNLGACKVTLADFNGARATLTAALEIDGAYPLPYFNLAMVEKLDGQETDAEALLAKSRQLGYAAAMTDRLVAAAGSTLARLEGLGSSAPPAGHCIHCGYDLRGNVSGVCPECGEPAR